MPRTEITVISPATITRTTRNAGECSNDL